MECVNEGWIKFDTEKDENRFIHLVRDIAPSAQNVPKDDLISRKAAIEALVKAIRKDSYYDSNEAINGLGVCDVRVILNDLPSAQPERG